MRKSFTLVELLIVIGIISILAALLLPALASARETAKQMSCASNLRQLALVTQNYGISYDGYLPAPEYVYTGPSGQDPNSDNASGFSGIVQLQLFAKNMQTIHAGFYRSRMFVCPSDKIPEHQMDYISARSTSYAPQTNPWSYSTKARRATGTCNKATTLTSMMDSVQAGKSNSPSSVVYLTEHTSDSQSIVIWQGASSISSMATKDFGMQFNWNIATFHGADKLGVNVLYFDSHVAQLGNLRTQYDAFESALSSYWKQ